MTYKKPINNRLHLTVQQKIKSLIKEENVFLEHRFKGHIADIYWQSQNIVFEVQCSKMSLEECRKRTNDFEKLGVDIIWILHQKNFNKKAISPMEVYLKKFKNAYYCNISQHGDGIIFDQEEVISNGVRIIKSYPLKIDLSMPRYTKFRKKLFFKGDKTDLGIIGRLRAFQRIWKLKWKIVEINTKRKLTYYYLYFRWKITI